MIWPLFTTLVIALSPPVPDYLLDAELAAVSWFGRIYAALLVEGFAGGLGLSLLSLGVLLCTVLCSHPLRQLNPCSALPPPWPQVVVLLDGNGFEVPQTSFSGGSGSGAERSGQAAVASGSGSTSSTASSSGGSSGSGGLSGGAIAGIVVGGECVGLLGAEGCQQAFMQG